MDIAKVFSDGESQTVILPEGYRFEGDEVLVDRVGNFVILMPKDEIDDPPLQNGSK